MSTTDVSEELLGRAAYEMSRAAKKSNYWNNYTRKRYFTDKEIMELLGIKSVRRLHRLMEEERTRRQIQRWDRDKICEAIAQFARKHNRWPNADDYVNWKDNGIPARQTASHWFEQSITINGRWSHVNYRHLIENETMERHRDLRRRPTLILSMGNATFRAERMRAYGIEDLIKVGEPIDKSKWGTLWRLPSDNNTDRWMHYVEVQNATANEDGTYEHFFLRVPPNITRAKAAVEWTFDVTQIHQIRQAS